MIIIVGSGLTGLWLGYQLLKLRLPFIILEKNDRVGGKVRSEFTDDGTLMDYGPSIIHSNQELIINLLDELNIETEISDGDITYKIDGCPTNVNYPKKAEGRVEQVVPKIKRCHFSYDEVRYFKYNTWRKSEDNIGTIMTIKYGFQQIIDRLYEKLKSRILLNTKVNHVGKGLVETSDGILKFEKLILCTTSMDARELYIHTTSETAIRAVSCAIPVSSSRLFIELKVPYQFENKFFVGGPNSSFGFAIVHSPTVILASYTDGEKAKGPINMKRILRELSIREEDVKETGRGYYEDAFERVPSYMPNHVIKQSIEVDKNVYQTFVPDAGREGQDQAWVESHLQTAKMVLKLITK